MSCLKSYVDFNIVKRMFHVKHWLDGVQKKRETLMFDILEEINSRPIPFHIYTADELWTDEHTSMKMLEYHLNESVDLSSRDKDFIDRSVQWIVSHFGIDMNTSIADFGCGPGLYTTLFAENNAEVTGIDFSGRSIRYARKVADQKGLDINYFQQNYLEFDTKKKIRPYYNDFLRFLCFEPYPKKDTAC